MKSGITLLWRNHCQIYLLILQTEFWSKHDPKHWPINISCFLYRCRNITYPLNLPQVSIVFIFVNEALSVILRSIHSAINRTPSHLLKEIILVDDNSNNSKEHYFRINPVLPWYNGVPVAVFTKIVSILRVWRAFTKPFQDEWGKKTKAIV